MDVISSWNFVVVGRPSYAQGMPMATGKSPVAFTFCEYFIYFVVHSTFKRVGTSTHKDVNLIIHIRM